MSCGIGQRLSSDLALLWLQHRPAAVARIRPLAWEPPYAVGAALKKTNKTKKELHPAWIKDRDHLFLLLEVKETSGATHSQKHSSAVRERRGTSHRASCQLPRDPAAKIHLVGGALSQAKARRSKMTGQRKPGRTAPIQVI